MSDAPLAGSILSKAGQDVRLLIAHVAREGKALEPGESAAVLDAAEKIASGTITPAEEGEFWKLYAELVKLAHPARIDSLYFGDYVTSVGGPLFDGSPIVTGIRKHEATIRKVRRLSVVSFIVTLILLAYLSITESLLKRNEELGREYQVLIAGAWQGTEIEAAVNLVLRRALTSSGQEIIDLPSPKTDEAIDRQREEPADGQATPAPVDAVPPEEPTEPGAEEDDAVPPEEPSERGAEEEDNWVDALGLMSARRGEIRKLVGVNDWLLNALRFGMSPEGGKDTQNVPYDVAGASAQRSINDVIAKYLLPTVAAILGVTVYLLRTASTRIQELSFRSNDASVYWHRLALGVVGGIAISWFAVTDTTGVLGSISPAALAFLVGYSVEVLYNILDSLVKALGGSRD